MIITCDNINIKSYGMFVRLQNDCRLVSVMSSITAEILISSTRHTVPS